MAVSPVRLSVYQKGATLLNPRLARAALQPMNGRNAPLSFRSRTLPPLPPSLEGAVFHIKRVDHGKTLFEQPRPLPFRPMSPSSLFENTLRQKSRSGPLRQGGTQIPEGNPSFPQGAEPAFHRWTGDSARRKGRPSAVVTVPTTHDPCGPPFTKSRPGSTALSMAPFESPDRLRETRDLSPREFPADQPRRIGRGFPFF